MKQFQNLFWIFTSIVLSSNIFACNHPTQNINVYKENKVISDSTKLRYLLIDIYKWHESKGNDYYLIYDGKTILGIDSIKLDSTLNAMRKTDFFSEEFLDNFKKIGQKIDFNVKKNPENYKDGYIYFPFQDYDTWYGGNGFTPNWNDLKIYNLSINQDSASFKWSCKKSEPKEFINVKLKRENGKWKLSHLQYIDLTMY